MGLLQLLLCFSKPGIDARFIPTGRAE
jgi:hypothetical protein